MKEIKTYQRDLLRGLEKVQKQMAKIKKQALRCKHEKSEVRKWE